MRGRGSVGEGFGGVVRLLLLAAALPGKAQWMDIFQFIGRIANSFTNCPASTFVHPKLPLLMIPGTLPT